jgi:hypothetical protein
MQIYIKAIILDSNNMTTLEITQTLENPTMMFKFTKSFSKKNWGSTKFKNSLIKASLTNLTPEKK